MKSIQTEIIIEAPQETVWNIIQDFEKYSDWNPFIIKVQGKASKGEQIEITLKPDGQEPQVFNPVLLSCSPNNKLCWRGVIRAGWLFQGTHYLILERTDNNHTRFIHGETFSGILTRTFLRKRGESITKGFRAMNTALKQKAEEGNR
jgi:hypothetical protein